MNSDQIIKMARGASLNRQRILDGCHLVNPEYLQRFADLVAQAEQKRIANRIRDLYQLIGGENFVDVAMKALATAIARDIENGGL